MSFSYFLLRISGYLLASLPLWFLYFLARFTAFIFNHVIRYRKEVVLENLKNAFPEKPDDEINAIASRFYRIFLETMFETVKLLRLDPAYLPKHIRLVNKEVLENHFRQGRSVIAVGGHYGNWEWLGTGLKALVPFRVIAVYKPLSNQTVDRLMFRVRSMNGSDLVPIKKAFREIQSSPIPTLSYLIADQAPNPDNAYWTSFLNQETAVFLGPERIARLTNSVVVFLRMRRTARGQYSVYVEELCKEPALVPEFEISEKHIRALENQIIDDPAPWLWSHKRWKHKKPS
ncbi:MAG: lysophospholipid acyltransferase family protein [Bacteroidia bacterium]|nr:lysophospholipid acyltransferase family protein [Bacteroidia bacterium]